MNVPLLEVLVDSVESARAAEAAGADRLEVCQNLFEGGTTPSIGLVATLHRTVRIPCQVMVRPRGGDFLYSDDEFAVMRQDLLAFRDLGVAGVVLGLLRPDGTVDAERTGELVRLARPMNVTFHRAIDVTRDPLEALETVIGLGIDRVLTSGGESTVLEGLETLTAMVRAAGDRIVVMPGGGIRERNVERVVRATGAREIHVSASGSVGSAMEFRNTRVPMGRELRAPEFVRQVVDPTRIAEYRRLTGGAAG